MRDMIVATTISQERGDLLGTKISWLDGKDNSAGTEADWNSQHFQLNGCQESNTLHESRTVTSKGRIKQSSGWRLNITFRKILCERDDNERVPKEG